MKRVNPKYFIIVSALIVVGLGLFFLNKNTGDLRNPASSDGSRVLDAELLLAEIPTENGFEFYMGYEDDELNICDEELQMVLTLEPEGFLIHSDSVDDGQEGNDHAEKKLVIEISNGCERGFVSPIFMKNLCGDESLNFEDDEGTTYELINTLGVSIAETPPREWKVKSLSLGGELISTVNQPGLSETIFSCR